MPWMDQQDWTTLRNCVDCMEETVKSTGSPDAVADA